MSADSRGMYKLPYFPAEDAVADTSSHKFNRLELHNYRRIPAADLHMADSYLAILALAEFGVVKFLAAGEGYRVYAKEAPI